MPQHYFQAITFISRHTIFLGLFDYVNHECVAEYVAHVIYIHQHDEAPVKKQKFCYLHLCNFADCYQQLALENIVAHEISFLTFFFKSKL